jgi:hypothetical protein
MTSAVFLLFTGFYPHAQVRERVKREEEAANADNVEDLKKTLQEVELKGTCKAVDGYGTFYRKKSIPTLESIIIKAAFLFCLPF